MHSGARSWTPRDPGGWRASGPSERPPWGNRDHDGSAWGGWREAPWNPATWNRPAQIVAMVLGFILFWPIGLGMLVYLWWSGKMGCFGRREAYAGASRENGQARPSWSGSAPWSAWFRCGRTDAGPTSGNRAFDEYRLDTLRRLEEEQQAFADYLDRLRFAKDKAEFDQFMAERWQRPPTAPTGDGPDNGPSGPDTTPRDRMDPSRKD